MSSPRVICEDLSQFNNILREMRTLDDKIIYALNNSLPTVSFTKGNNEQEVHCDELYKKISKAFEDRGKVIKNCIKVTEDNLAISEDSSSARQLRLRLRLMKNELNVEDVVQKRTKTVFYERCRDYYISS